MSEYTGWIWATVISLAAGQWVDRLVVRTPFNRSLFWPLRDRCPHCHASMPWGWSVPIVGILLAGWRCSTCGHRRRWRSPIVQLITFALALSAYGLYFPALLGGEAAFIFPDHRFSSYHAEHLWALWVYHAILISLLVAATFVDFDWMIVPDSITVPGMLLAILLGTFWYVELHPVPLFHPPLGADGRTYLITATGLEEYLGWKSLSPTAEDFIARINEHWQQYWNRWLGFATGLVGLIIGGGTVWIVRAICSWVFRVEAIGFGDVTLMAMVGAFLGWQTTVIAFFLAPFSAVVVGVAVWIMTGNRAIPYGPHLAIGSLFCLFAWRPLWAQAAPVFEHTGIVLFFALAMIVTLVVVSMTIQGIKMLALSFR